MFSLSASHRSHYLRLAPLLAVALIMTVLSFAMIISGYKSLQVGYQLSKWQVSGSPDIETWQRTHQNGQAMQSLYPVGNGFLSEQLGKINEWSVYAIQDTADNQFLQSALENYRTQSVLTPKWPMVWLNILTVKLRLQQIDKEFENAFNRAVLTTGENPVINYDFIVLSSYLWPHLNYSQKATVASKAMLVLQQNDHRAKKLFNHLQQTQLDGFMCSYFKLIKKTPLSMCK